MARLSWLILILAFAGALLTGASWAAAYSSVGTLLGAPPPRMGTQTTTIRWQGLSRVLEHPPQWRFAFGPTAIPGATRVIIDVNPLGHIISTEPADLAERIKAFHNTGY
jgi:hypothetical protein